MELPKRKPTRLRNYDYNIPGAYFITICTQDKRQILSRIVGGDILDAPKSATNTTASCKSVGGDVLDAPNSIKLLPHGEIANKYINRLNDFYEDLKVEHYVIMPNHIHILLFVYDSVAFGNGASRTSPPTAKQHAVVSRFVSTFKRFCNKEYGVNIWQRHFNDHIIRNRQDYEEHIKYISENPMKWQADPLFAKE